MDDSENSIKNLLGKVDSVLKIKTKEPSIKVVIGKEDMNDNDLAENILTTYNMVFASLPKKMEQLKNIMIKFTMTHPVKVKFK